MVAEYESRQPSEIEPTASSSVWINDADLLFRDLLRGALAHLLGVIRHRIFRGAASTYSLGDQLIWAEFNRQLGKPRPALGPDASTAEKWLAEDLDPFEGIERFYRA